MVRPAPERPGSHLGRRAPAFTFIAPRGLVSPLTRARVRLLGPCFKTGLVVSRHRRRPHAPVYEGRSPPVAARRGQGALRTVRPGRQSRRGRGAPCPAGAGQDAEIRFPRPRGETAKSDGRAVKLGRGKPTEPPSRTAFQADPEPVATHRRGESAPGEGTGQRPGRGRANPIPGPRRPTRRRVESSGQTARTPPVYLLTVSRPVELSLQSSFQLSLTVLVRYRTRASI